MRQKSKKEKLITLRKERIIFCFTFHWSQKEEPKKQKSEAIFIFDWFENYTQLTNLIESWNENFQFQTEFDWDSRAKNFFFDSLLELKLSIEMRFVQLIVSNLRNRIFLLLLFWMLRNAINGYVYRCRWNKKVYGYWNHFIGCFLINVLNIELILLTASWFAVLWAGEAWWRIIWVLLRNLKTMILIQRS